MYLAFMPPLWALCHMVPTAAWEAPDLLQGIECI